MKSEGTPLAKSEEEAIRLTNIAMPLVENDDLTMFSSEEDKLIYEHFFIHGMEYRDAEIDKLRAVLKATVQIIENNNSLWLFEKDFQTLETARNILHPIS